MFSPAVREKSSRGDSLWLQSAAQHSMTHSTPHPCLAVLILGGIKCLLWFSNSKLNTNKLKIQQVKYLLNLLLYCGKVKGVKLTKNESAGILTDLGSMWQWSAADLWAPAGCTVSPQPRSAEADSVWTRSPPDPAPGGWTRSGQTAPAAGGRHTQDQQLHVQPYLSQQGPPGEKSLPLVWSPAHQKALVTLCATCDTRG